MPIGLIALALGGFGIGLTEFVIMGLLPEVAADFQVSEATAGWLISGYALAVVVGALLPHRRRDALRAQARAGRADGAVHRRQPGLRRRARLLG